MKDRELFEIVKEIIISCQPLACSTSKIRSELHKHDVYKDSHMMLKFLRQWQDRDSNLVCGKIGREYFWRYNDGCVLS
ncbi:hypothetical protein [Methanobrevibacter sp.]|uniref:hypothetical protein n=1 Tax=Methanobrevibacter sp. TaxID=66852 RepID=UPI0038635EEC